MASDFGDESGEKLFDWLLRIGQDAGQQAMLDTADKLTAAFRKAREGLGGDWESVSENKDWAKLDMKDFTELPTYETLKEIIGDALASRGATHEFASEAGREYLIFKVKDVHEVSEVFHDLEKSTHAASERAKKTDIPEKKMERAEMAHGRAKSPDLSAPATEKQDAYIDSLRERNVISSDKLEKTAGTVVTVGAANEILNRYGRFLKLDRDSEPLEQRAATARQASKALESVKNADREIPLSQGRSK